MLYNIRMARESSTQLCTVCVGVDKVVKVLRDPVLGHATLACYGMEQDPIAVTFSKKEIREFHSEETATQCGLLTESTKSTINMSTSTFTPVHYFQRLTLQWFLVTVTIVTQGKRPRGMLTMTSHRQLDCVLYFSLAYSVTKRINYFSVDFTRTRE